MDPKCLDKHKDILVNKSPLLKNVFLKMKLNYEMFLAAQKHFIIAVALDVKVISDKFPMSLNKSKYTYTYINFSKYETLDFHSSL